MSDWKDRLREYVPFGLAEPNKPHHYRAILETLSETKGHWRDAWKALQGPCNGCAVQTDGLRDNVLPGQPHFCLIRLGLLEEAIRGDIDPGRLQDIEQLNELTNPEIERLGRITKPMIRKRGERGFTLIDWEKAYEIAGEWIKKYRGDQSGFFTTSKAVCNEDYFAFQQFARVVGQTNNVDSCARQCHAASVTALKQTIGIGATTGSLSDFAEADVLVLSGTNLANNQPLSLRYIEHGRRKRGGKPYIIVVNAYRERGLEKYWVPSSPLSAFFGTRFCDQFVQVRVGGDVAFFNGLTKVLIEDNLLTPEHDRFVAEQTSGFEDLKRTVADQSFDQLERISGVPRAMMADVARRLARSSKTTFVWGMGLTQHACGTDNIKSVVNVALALGQFGRPGAGVAPLRGQSSVQAAGECGVAPNIFPGGEPINAETAKRFGAAWGCGVPAQPGIPTGPMIEEIEAGGIHLLTALGGNLYDTLPDRSRVKAAIEKLPFRIRLDVMLNREALIEPGDSLLILPIRNWFEYNSVYTTTSTDRTIRAFTGTLQHRHQKLPECWLALRHMARHVLGPKREGFNYRSTDDIREAMDRDIWMYHGIAELNAPHRQMQWGGACLFKNGFDQMPDGRARFSPLTPDEAVIPAGQFRLSSRRGWGQWNSQHRTNVQKDSLTPASSKRSVLMNPADAESLDLKPGDAVALTNPQGQDYIGFCRPDDAQQARHVQVFWPASNDIIPSGIYDDASKEPDYNVLVTIRKSTQSPAELSHVHAD